MENVENKKRVLIVDDDENLVTVLVDKLNFSNFNTEGAMDGEEGLKKALAFHPDIILLDMIMPKMGGLEMLKELRKDSWGKSAKVVILTAVEQIDLMAEAVDNNVFGYFVKTNYSLDKIVKKIEDTLKVSKNIDPSLPPSSREHY